MPAAALPDRLGALPPGAFLGGWIDSAHVLQVVHDAPESPRPYRLQYLDLQGGHSLGKRADLAQTRALFQSLGDQALPSWSQLEESGWQAGRADLLGPGMPRPPRDPAANLEQMMGGEPTRRDPEDKGR